MKSHPAHHFALHGSYHASSLDPTRRPPSASNQASLDIDLVDALAWLLARDATPVGLPLAGEPLTAAAALAKWTSATVDQLVSSARALLAPESPTSLDPRLAAVRQGLQKALELEATGDATVARLLLESWLSVADAARSGATPAAAAGSSSPPATGTGPTFQRRRTSKGGQAQTSGPSPAAGASSNAGPSFIAAVRAKMADPSAKFGASGLSRAEAFTAIGDLRGQGVTNANDLYPALERDYGLDPREVYVLYSAWLDQNLPEQRAQSKAAAEAARRDAALGAIEYYKGLGQEPPAHLLERAGLAPAPAGPGASTTTPAASGNNFTVAELESAVAASLAQGFTIAQTKLGAFEKYGITQEQWNAINWANIPGGSTGPR